MTDPRLIEMLTDKKSAKRASAAKAIGRTAESQYGPCLLEALQKEAADLRTWQAQCTMIRALSDIGFRQALDYLWQFSERTIEHTMIYEELGFSIGRLTPISNSDISVVRQISRSSPIQFSRGIFRAIYFLRIVPEKSEDAVFLISEARKDFENEGRVITKRCYLAATAAGWSEYEARPFLEECRNTEWKMLKEIVELSLARTYSKWKPW
jgi:hypothetical protein